MAETSFKSCFKGMGSPCSILLYSDDVGLMQQAKDEVRRLEKKYSRYLPESVLSRINKNAGKGCQPIDSETKHLLDYASAANSLSEGLFDITSGILRKLWDFKSKRIPKAQQIATFLPKVDWSQVHYDASSLTLPEGMEIDFGGIVKEYAADRISLLCRVRGCHSGMINLGGDIRTIGAQPCGKPWVVGIRDPKNPDNAMAHIELVDTGLATSGSYERFFDYQGKRYCHILNPKTGWPVESTLASVSVQAEQCILAGTFATIAMLKGNQGCAWLDSLDINYYSATTCAALSK